jgi:hypothetical protein
VSLRLCGDHTDYATISAAIAAGPDGVSVLAGAVAGTGNAYPEAISITKRVTLSGDLALPTGPGVRITGAGGGAAPAVLSSGNGKLTLNNFEVSNAGSAAVYVVEGNVAEDWFSRLLIRGGGVAKCLQGQFMENLILADGAAALDPSCGGQVICYHLTAVNHTGYGLLCNASGWAQGCLAYNCNALGFSNLFSAIYSAWNGADDATLPGVLAKTGLTLADIAFLNYAGGDYRLSPATLAYQPGISPVDVDFLGNRRLRAGAVDLRIVMGGHDPWPGAPSFITPGSAIRRF